MANLNLERAGCLTAFLSIFRKRKHHEYRPHQTQTPQFLPYSIRDDFLSPAELSFYKNLALILEPQYKIQSKVRLADIFYVSRHSVNRTFFYRIAQRHLDFLVCEPMALTPLFGIELDDSSHQRSDRQERDRFVNDLFKTAGLPLLRFPAQRTYRTEELRQAIEPVLVKRAAVVQARVNQKVYAEPGTTPFCPSCGLPMIKRTVSKGKNQGKQFYGCSNYPQCRRVVLIP